MRFTFRAKLLAIVGIGAFSFFVAILTNVILTKQVLREFTSIQNEYVPMVELGPRLDVQFEKIQRSFQDAVGANDREALAETAKLKDEFFHQLASGQDYVDPAKADSLRASMEDYFSAASNVSQRLIAGETGEMLIITMNSMQEKQMRTAQFLKEATAFDRNKLAEAFDASRRAQITARRVQLSIGLLCLAVAIALSFWMSHVLLGGLRGLTSGFANFGRGDFSGSIPIVNRDELGDVAAQANQMAEQIRGLMKEREAQSEALKNANAELEAFSYSVAHDLRAPLRSVLGFSDALVEDYAALLPPEAKSSLERVSAAARKMGRLIDDLLGLSRLTRKDMRKETVNLSDLTFNILAELQRSDPKRKITIGIEKNVVGEGDPQLLQIALANLLANAWKFSSKRPESRIEFGSSKSNGHAVYYVRDNGAGFDMRYSNKLFGTFQRLHTQTEFEGTGIGLATVQRIVNRHGGKTWAESAPDKGATFYFTLA